MGIGKVFRGSPPRGSASHFVCMCVLSLYILYMSGMLRHGEKDSLQLKNGKKWVGYLHPLYLKYKLKSLFLKTTA